MLQSYILLSTAYGRNDSTSSVTLTVCSLAASFLSTTMSIAMLPQDVFYMWRLKFFLLTVCQTVLRVLASMFFAVLVTTHTSVLVFVGVAFFFWVTTLVSILTGIIFSKSGDPDQHRSRTKLTEALVMSFILLLVPIEIDSITQIAESNPKQPTRAFFWIRMAENVVMCASIVFFDHAFDPSQVYENPAGVQRRADTATGLGIVLATLLLVTLMMQFVVQGTQRSDPGTRILVRRGTWNLMSIATFLSNFFFKFAGGQNEVAALDQPHAGGARRAAGAKDAVSAQKLAQLQPFPQECMGQPAYFGPT
jgi:hypothetical protein